MGVVGGKSNLVTMALPWCLFNAIKNCNHKIVDSQHWEAPQVLPWPSLAECRNPPYASQLADIGPNDPLSLMENAFRLGVKLTIRKLFLRLNED